MTPLELLQWPQDDLVQWRRDLRISLDRSSSDWIAEFSRIADDQAWVLLSWAEDAASEIVRSRDRSLLVACVFAAGLLLRSALDARDVLVVVSLMRRGAALAGIEYREAALEGSVRANSDAFSRGLLLTVSSETQSTHTEVGAGTFFEFRRTPSGFDGDALLRWWEDGENGASDNG